MLSCKLCLTLLWLVLPSATAFEPASGKYDKLRVSTSCDLKDTFAIENVRVFHGQSFGEPETVVVDGCTIGTPSDRTSAKSFDGTGKYLIPGFIESHSHPRNITHLQRQSQGGITTIFSLSCQPNSECLALMDHPGVAELHTSGQAAIVPGSRHSKIPGMNSSLFVADVEDVAGFLDGTIDTGGELIKIVSELPPDGPSEATIRSIYEGAKARGFMVTSHVTNREAYQMNLAAGVRFLQHIPIDYLLESVGIASHSDQVVCPTLSMMLANSMPGGMRPVPYNYSVAVENLRMLRKQGVTIVAGTDSSDLPFPLVPSTMDGKAFHKELKLLVEAGMSTVEAIRAATTVPAEVWGFQDRGEIAVGKRADLVLLSKNPIEDIDNTDSIEQVWTAGHEVIRGGDEERHIEL